MDRLVYGAGCRQQEDRLDDGPRVRAVRRVVPELDFDGGVLRVGPGDAFRADDDAHRAAFEADPALGAEVVHLRDAAADMRDFAQAVKDNPTLLLLSSDRSSDKRIGR